MLYYLCKSDVTASSHLVCCSIYAKFIVVGMDLGRTLALFGSRYNCSVLGIVTTLTTNYGVRQSQFTKPTSEPRASDLEESNKVFDRVIRG